MKSDNDRYVLDQHIIDKDFQFVDVENNATWGRFIEEEKQQLEFTVGLLNRQDKYIKYLEGLVEDNRRVIDNLKSDNEKLSKRKFPEI